MYGVVRVKKKREGAKIAQCMEYGVRNGQNHGYLRIDGRFYFSIPAIQQLFFFSFFFFFFFLLLFAFSFTLLFR